MPWRGVVAAIPSCSRFSKEVFLTGLLCILNQ